VKSLIASQTSGLSQRFRFSTFWEGQRVVISEAAYNLVTKDSFSDLLSKLENRLQLATQHLISFGSIKDELAQTDLVYRFLFENTLDGVVFTSPDLQGGGAETIIAANKAACDMLGYKIEEMLGMCMDDLFFAEDMQLASAIAERAEQKVFKGELVFRRKSGSPIHLDVTSILSNLKSGQRRSMSILRDWAQEFNLERERAERSRLESIAQMTGGISHDFNNLLTVIQSAAEHLDECISDVDQKDVVGDILAAASRAATLTSQLLAYSRRQNLQPLTVDVNSAIQQIERLIKTVVRSEVTIRYDYSRRPLLAEIDIAQLTTALVNLIKNANDAIDTKGRITVTTRLERDPNKLKTLSLRPGVYVTVAVGDNGDGIAPKSLRRIFDPFFTTKSLLGGSGLGLSMVQGFARQSGGEIVVQSTPGRGTTATLYLPSAMPLSKAVTAERFPARAELIREGEVLIVDDDPLIRRQVARIVKSLGMTAIEAAAADEAIGLLKRLPKIVLTDLAMPGERTGIDVMEACQRSVPRIPVIVMSGFAADPRWATATLKAQNTIDKPFSRKKLVAAIERALN
jgi:PAS domain S-box-containing protein